MGQAASMAIETKVGELKPMLTFEELRERYPEALGKAANVIPADPNKPNPIAIITASACLPSITPKFRKLLPGEDFKDYEQREREDTVSVARAQPHRRGSDDPRAGEPLFEFCRLHQLRSECYAAGNRYAEIVGEAKTAQGFSVPGWTPGDSGFEKLTFAQIEARKELALIKLKNAEAVLRAVMPRLPARMESLTFDQREPSPYDHGALRNGLWRLAVEFGLIKLGVNVEKTI